MKEDRLTEWYWYKYRKCFPRGLGGAVLADLLWANLWLWLLVFYVAILKSL